MFRNLTIHTPLSNKKALAMTLHDEREFTVLKLFITIFSS